MVALVTEDKDTVKVPDESVFPRDNKDSDTTQTHRGKHRKRLLETCMEPFEC